MSFADTLVRSSIFSTSACGVGTQITSLPAWPTCGSNGFLLGCASAMPKVTIAATPASASDRVTDCVNLIEKPPINAQRPALRRRCPPGRDISRAPHPCQQHCRRILRSNSVDDRE
jgi:hypothetical protein